MLKICQGAPFIKTQPYRMASSMKYIPILAVAALVYYWFNHDASIELDDGTQMAYSVEYTSAADRNDTLPMLIALHGNGDTPDHFFSTALNELAAPARIILLHGPLSYGSGKAWPTRGPEAYQQADAVNEAIEKLVDKFPTRGKPALLGFSGGGVMAYYLALSFGDDYSYIFPISGMLSPSLVADLPVRRGAKIHAFHGNHDRVIGVSGARKAVTLLEERDIGVEFVEFDGGHLGLFTDMKSDITALVDRQLRKL